MAEEKKYAQGFRIFSPNENAPDFVVGSVVVNPREFTNFMASMKEHFTEYNGQKQLKFQILKGSKGMYMAVDTYKPKNTQNTQNAQDPADLPF